MYSYSFLILKIFCSMSFITQNFPYIFSVQMIPNLLLYLLSVQIHTMSKELLCVKTYYFCICAATGSRISGITPITEINCFLLHSFSFILFSSVLEAKWRLGRLNITFLKKVMPKNRSATKTANSPEFLIFTNYSFSVKIFDKFALFQDWINA